MTRGARWAIALSVSLLPGLAAMLFGTPWWLSMPVGWYSGWRAGKWLARTEWAPRKGTPNVSESRARAH